MRNAVVFATAIHTHSRLLLRCGFATISYIRCLNHFITLRWKCTKMSPLARGSLYRFYTAVRNPRISPGKARLSGKCKAAAAGTKL